MVAGADGAGLPGGEQARAGGQAGHGSSTSSPTVGGADGSAGGGGAAAAAGHEAAGSGAAEDGSNGGAAAAEGGVAESCGAAGVEAAIGAGTFAAARPAAPDERQPEAPEEAGRGDLGRGGHAREAGQPACEPDPRPLLSHRPVEAPLQAAFAHAEQAERGLALALA